MISGENRRQNKGSQGHLHWQGLGDHPVQCPHLMQNWRRILRVCPESHINQKQGQAWTTMCRHSIQGSLPFPASQNKGAPLLYQAEEPLSLKIKSHFILHILHSSVSSTSIGKKKQTNLAKRNVPLNSGCPHRLLDHSRVELPHLAQSAGCVLGFSAWLNENREPGSFYIWAEDRDGE